MNFLTPLFLLGALAVALPVVFHLIRRTTRERKLFSSLLFLSPTPPRVTRRSRLEHLLLLACRCAALCLLALGFARPFLRHAASSEPSASAVGRLVVLMDTSASMRRANLWAEARNRAEALLRKVGPADELALFSFDRQTTSLVTFEDWKRTAPGDRPGLVAAKLADLSPSWSATHVGNAIIAGTEALADAGGKAPTGRRQIVLVSDLQEGSHLDQLQGYEWPKGIELSVEPVKPRRSGNAGLQLATDSEEGGPGGPRVRVRVNNAADSKREQFKVGWAQPSGTGFAGRPTDVYVPPGQSRIITLEAGKPGTNTPAAVTGLTRVLLQGDDEEFDNSVYVIPPETARFQVIYLGNEPVHDTRQPLYLLERAFQETRKQAVQVRSRAATNSGPETWRGAELIVATDPLPDAEAQVLSGLITNGQTVLFALKSAGCAATLARLAGLERLEVTEAKLPQSALASYAMLAEIDFRHPLFAPFADARFSDFTKIHFWKYRRIESGALPAARVLARFDNGDPAILEIPSGKGRLIVLTFGWQPEDSQFALSTKFVPFLYALLEQTSARSFAPSQFQVGDVVPLGPATEGRSDLSVKLPDGAEVKLAAGETNFAQTFAPGVYEVSAAGSPGLSKFAVNLDAAESRTAPLPLDEFERLGAPVARPVADPARETERRISLQSAELESRQKLWRWLILAALAVLLAETWLAARTTRPPASSTA